MAIPRKRLQSDTRYYRPCKTVIETKLILGGGSSYQCLLSPLLPVGRLPAGSVLCLSQPLENLRTEQATENDQVIYTEGRAINNGTGGPQSFGLCPEKSLNQVSVFVNRN